MQKDDEFSTRDINTKRNYLLEVFEDLKDTYPVYQTIYTYLHDAIEGREDMLDLIYDKLDDIGDYIHEKDILSKYSEVADKINHIKQSEQKDIDNAEALITSL